MTLRSLCARRAASALLALAVVAVTGDAAADDRTPVRDDLCGVEVTLPGADWKMKPMGAGGVICHVWSPSENIVPRFSAIREPVAFAPAGMATRARQLGTPRGQAIEVRPGTIAGVKAERIEWTEPGVRAVEYGLARGLDFVVVQVAAPETWWTDAERGAELQAIFDSVRFIAPDPGPVAIDQTTPEQVRAARAAQERPRAFAVRSHDVKVALDPVRHSLTCSDQLTVEGLGPDASELALRLTTQVMTIDSVRLGGQVLTCDTAVAGLVRIALPATLRRGDKVVLEYAAHADDYFLAADQKLLTELGVLAQARETSSFSSHGIYFPTDTENDASVRLRVSVPAGFVPVSGGPVVASNASEEGARTDEWAFDARPRILPPGFAAAAYASSAATTAGGLTIEVFHFRGEEAAAARVLGTAMRAARLFEERMGPLPWTKVAVCHVRPERKQIAVSLPGLVLLSDAFFGSEPAGTLLGADFVAGLQSGVMGVVDELAHQWNGYEASYPNELAEGLSSYADLLFVESESGPDEYRAAVRTCASFYVAAAERETDMAVANPAIYRTQSYRAIVFAKTPAVLHLLRQRLGEKAFFAGWRAAFESAPRGRALTFDDFRAAFETAAGLDLRPFFDAWFFRPGHPRVRVAWEAAPCDGHPGVRIRVTQVQPGPPFDIDVPLLMQTAKGAGVFMFALRTREDASLWPLPDAATGVELDPSGDVPLVRVVGR